MENSTQDANSHLINSFMEITSSTKDEALFFLESHQWDLDAAVSTFLDDDAAPVPAAATEDSQPVSTVPAVNSPSHSNSPSTSPSSSVSRSRSRSRSPSPAAAREPYELRSRRRPGKKEDKKAATGTSRGGIRTLADLNSTPPGDAAGSDDDDNDDELQRYYTGGEKSCMRVQDPTRGNNVDAIFDQARESVVERPNLRPSSSSNTFTGTARLLSGETVSSAPAPPPEHVSHDITFWSNGFTVDDGPLRSMDDPANASFLESITRSECPKELEPADRRIRVHVELINKREEDYSEPPKRRSAFQGVGRTLGGSDTPASTASEPTFTGASLNTAPPPSSGLVVDASLPTTSIQLRLADGTRLVSRFNHHHTIRDIHRFIDASRPGGARNYQLQAMGFPPKQLTDLDQTVEQADIANSVVVQKL